MFNSVRYMTYYTLWLFEYKGMHKSYVTNTKSLYSIRKCSTEWSIWHAIHCGCFSFNHKVYKSCATNAQFKYSDLFLNFQKSFFHSPSMGWNLYLDIVIFQHLHFQHLISLEPFKFLLVRLLNPISIEFICYTI